MLILTVAWWASAVWGVLGDVHRLFACGKLAVAGTVWRSLVSDQSAVRRPGLAFPNIMAILR